MYTFKYGGKNGSVYQLEEAKDLVVVRTKTDQDLKDMKMTQASRDLLPKMLQVGHFPEANVSIFKLVENSARSARAVRDDVRKTLSREEGVAFAGRVLKDKKSGSILLYTENFFVKFHDEVTVKRCREILKIFKLKVKDKLKFAKNSFFAEAKQGTGLKIFEIAEGLLKYEEVEYAHPELIREKKHKFINRNQWHLKKTKINGMTIDQHVDIVKAWKQTKGEGIVIAVIDDGVDIDHPEFKDKVVAPRDTLLNINDPRPKHFSENHGTACAGVACASGIKASGVAPQAKLMPIRAGGLGSMSEANAFVWAVENGADVISCSWGPLDGAWWHTNDPLHQTFFALPDSTRLAIDFAVTQGRKGKGCVIAWAAGNGNESVSFDGYASNQQVLAIAACNDRGKRSVYSDFGKEVICCFPSNDFFFPQFNNPRPISDGIWTTDRIGNQGYEPGDYTSSFGGTSSACPGVAGVVALMLSVNPELYWTEVREIVKESCDKIDDEMGNYDENGHSPFYGYGRINAHKAIIAAKAKSMVMDEEPENYAIQGTALFHGSEEVALKGGTLSKALDTSSRLLGFTLELAPSTDELGLKYQAIINNKGKTEFCKTGEYCGVKDKRRKIIGFSVALTGAQAEHFELIYRAVFDEERDTIVSATTGEVLGKSSGKGKSIERMSVEIKSKK